MGEIVGMNPRRRPPLSSGRTRTLETPVRRRCRSLQAGYYTWLGKNPRWSDLGTLTLALMRAAEFLRELLCVLRAVESILQILNQVLHQIPSLHPREAGREMNSSPDPGQAGAFAFTRT